MIVCSGPGGDNNVTVVALAHGWMSSPAAAPACSRRSDARNSFNRGVPDDDYQFGDADVEGQQDDDHALPQTPQTHQQDQPVPPAATKTRSRPSYESVVAERDMLNLAFSNVSRQLDECFEEKAEHKRQMDELVQSKQKLEQHWIDTQGLKNSLQQHQDQIAQIHRNYQDAIELKDEQIATQIYPLEKRKAYLQKHQLSALCSHLRMGVVKSMGSLCEHLADLGELRLDEVRRLRKYRARAKKIETTIRSHDVLSTDELAAAMAHLDNVDEDDAETTALMEKLQAAAEQRKHRRSVRPTVHRLRTTSSKGRSQAQRLRAAAIKVATTKKAGGKRKRQVAEGEDGDQASFECECYELEIPRMLQQGRALQDQLLQEMGERITKLSPVPLVLARVVRRGQTAPENLDEAAVRRNTCPTLPHGQRARHSDTAAAQTQAHVEAQVEMHTDRSPSATPVVRVQSSVDVSEQGGEPQPEPDNHESASDVSVDHLVIDDGAGVEAVGSDPVVAASNAPEKEVVVEPLSPLPPLPAAADSRKEARDELAPVAVSQDRPMAMAQVVETLPVPVPGPVKRGRGRPKGSTTKRAAGTGTPAATKRTKMQKADGGAIAVTVGAEQGEGDSSGVQQASESVCVQSSAVAVSATPKTQKQPRMKRIHKQTLAHGFVPLGAPTGENLTQSLQGARAGDSRQTAWQVMGKRSLHRPVATRKQLVQQLARQKYAGTDDTAQSATGTAVGGSEGSASVLQLQTSPLSAFSPVVSTACVSVVDGRKGRVQLITQRLHAAVADGRIAQEAVRSVMQCLTAETQSPTQLLCECMLIVVGDCCERHIGLRAAMGNDMLQAWLDKLHSHEPQSFCLHSELVVVSILADCLAFEADEANAAQTAVLIDLRTSLPGLFVQHLVKAVLRVLASRDLHNRIRHLAGYLRVLMLWLNEQRVFRADDTDCMAAQRRMLCGWCVPLCRAMCLRMGTVSLATPLFVQLVYAAKLCPAFVHHFIDGDDDVHKVERGQCRELLCCVYVRTQEEGHRPSARNAVFELHLCQVLQWMKGSEWTEASLLHVTNGLMSRLDSHKLHLIFKSNDWVAVGDNGLKWTADGHGSMQQIMWLLFALAPVQQVKWAWIAINATLHKLIELRQQRSLRVLAHTDVTADVAKVQEACNWVLVSGFVCLPMLKANLELQHSQREVTLQEMGAALGTLIEHANELHREVCALPQVLSEYDAAATKLKLSFTYLANQYLFCTRA